MGRWRLLPALVALSICIGCSPSSAPEMEKMVDTYMEGLVGCPLLVRIHFIIVMVRWTGLFRIVSQKSIPSCGPPSRNVHAPSLSQNQNPSLVSLFFLAHAHRLTCTRRRRIRTCSV